jgi:iron complex outermembrane receptor protein
MSLKMTTALAALLGATALGGPALGQVASTGDGQAVADKGVHIEEVVVTARRREESLQKVPMAVTALTTEVLKAQNITRLENLGTAVPSLIISPSIGRSNTPTFAIRGQRAESYTTVADSSVGIYVAEAVQARIFGLAQSLFDIESIQVLKGPQGTLFGRNSTGGAILIQPNRPRLGDDVNGYVQVRYGNYDRFDVQGAVTLPLSSTLAARLSFNHTERDGYVKNVTLNEKLYGENSNSFRGVLLFEPSPQLSNTFYADYFKSDTSASSGILTAVNPASPIQGKADVVGALARQLRTLSFYETEGDVRSFARGSNVGFTNVTVYELSDAVTLKNIANYRRIKSTDNGNGDATAFALLTTTDDTQEVKQYTEELQLQARLLDNRLNLIGGGYYFREHGFRHITLEVLGAPANPRLGTATNTSTSVFAQGDYKLTDSLTFTAGGRYTWDKREYAMDYRSGVTKACIFCGAASKDFHAGTYTATLAWQADPHTLLYATTRRGYRAGGFGPSPSSAAELQPFDPETVTDYEVGLKSDLTVAGGAVRTNIAAYHSDYQAIQRTIVILVGGQPVASVFNAASANVDGVEGEVQYVPTRRLELSGSAVYTKPKYVDFQYRGPTGALIDQSRNHFALIPRWTYRLAGRFEVPTGESTTKVFIGADYYWQSKVFMTEFNTFRAEQGAYGQLNGRIDFENVGGSNVDVALWARNLQQKHYYTYGIDQYAALGFVTKYVGQPRTYGIELSSKF